MIFNSSEGQLKWKKKIINSERTLKDCWVHTSKYLKNGRILSSATLQASRHDLSSLHICSIEIKIWNLFLFFSFAKDIKLITLDVSRTQIFPILLISAVKIKESFSKSNTFKNSWFRSYMISNNIIQNC